MSRMARSRTQKHKEKRRTMRKPRASLRITNNNLNLNDDPNLEANLINVRQELYNRPFAKILDTVPDNSFLFSIGGQVTKPGTKRLILAKDFVDYIYKSDSILWNSNLHEIKILYKGREPRDSYFCYCLLSSHISPMQGEHIYNIYYERRGIPPLWNIYYFPAVDFFKDAEDYFFPEEPYVYFFSRGEALLYLASELPFLREKIKKEKEAMKTLPLSLQRLHRRTVAPTVEHASRKIRREVPENVESIIRSFI